MELLVSATPEACTRQWGRTGSVVVEGKVEVIAVVLKCGHPLEWPLRHRDLSLVAEEHEEEAVAPLAFSLRVELSHANAGSSKTMSKERTHDGSPHRQSLGCITPATMLVRLRWDRDQRDLYRSTSAKLVDELVDTLGEVGL